MTKVTAKVEGMMCGMCEAHVNDAVRNNFKVKKVNASHTKNQLTIIAEEEIDTEKLKEIIDKTGYTISDIKQEPYEKKGLFSFGKK